MTGKGNCFVSRDWKRYFQRLAKIIICVICFTGKLCYFKQRYLLLDLQIYVFLAKDGQMKLCCFQKLAKIWICKDKTVLRAKINVCCSKYIMYCSKDLITYVVPRTGIIYFQIFLCCSRVIITLLMQRLAKVTSPKTFCGNTLESGPNGPGLNHSRRAWQRTFTPSPQRQNAFKQKYNKNLKVNLFYNQFHSISYVPI